MDALRLPALLPRGVSYADYLVDGRPVLQAIDRAGNCIKRIRVEHDVDPDVVWTWLEGYLENKDPERRLRLVPTSAPRPPINVGLMLRMIRVHELRQRAAKPNAFVEP